MDIYEITKIITEISKFKISYFEYKDNEIKIKILRPNNIANKNSIIDQISCSKETLTHHVVTSKYVGIIKLLDESTLSPFVYIGMEVKIGDMLCKIEYLNNTIDILADYSGVISDICIKDSTLVDYGKKIMVISY